MITPIILVSCHAMPGHATLPAFHFFFRLFISNPSSLMMITLSPSPTIAVRSNLSSSRISIELHFHVSTLFANFIKQCYVTQEIEVVGGISLFRPSHHFLWGVQWFKSIHCYIHDSLYDDDYIESAQLVCNMQSSRYSFSMLQTYLDVMTCNPNYC